MEQDAVDLSEALCTHGYSPNVLVGRAATRTAIEQKLEETLQRVTGGTVFCCISAHAEHCADDAGSECYLVPYGARNVEALPREGVPFSTLRRFCLESAAS